MIKNLFSGLAFGLILQLSIGPVCLYVLKNSLQKNLLNTEVLILAVVLVDALYILLALAGISKLIKNKKNILILKIFSFIILFFYGFFIIILEFNLPHLNLNFFKDFDNPFLTGFILTISNPLTIIFWGGVFTSKIVSKDFTKKELFIFSVGCILATLLFLNFIALSGVLIKNYLTPDFTKILNLIVGLFLIFFSIKILFKKIDLNMG
ncbi:MAG: hypothetical protein A2086_16015 [Spirochaetes bacterium GWD1_27_9]|nr:MAG: hypothetical protein A2Z98_11370 [Spirochaetes bacterium GWB1_27_13]OHD22545.1 MAG: hypothetical protein A2Y34_11040 [Spirochaetes bacterium GWC1_27_15]OHD36221.1 MAG: hypothetical protein A2086_16015 [Spirochaetes bacterium GWD1_27_9]